MSSALRRRRRPQKKGLGQALTGLLSAGAARRVAPSSTKGKSGGFAMLAAGAGLAFKNRAKLTALVARRGGAQAPPTSPTATSPLPADDRP